MKRIVVFIVFLFFYQNYAQTSRKIISGRVTNVWETPIPNVNIWVKESDRGTQTDEFGRFSLHIDPDDILVFSSVGYGSVELNPPKEGEVHMVLSPTTTNLDEVTVTKRKRKGRKDRLAEYDQRKELIKTSIGIIDKDRSSSYLRIIEGKDLVNAGTDFLTSLQNHNLNMRVVRPPHAPDVEVYFRRISYASLTNDSLNIPPKAIFDVDGFIQESAPIYLSSNEIDRIAILERNAAITRYGPRGVGGVIIVNTKAKNDMDREGLERSYNNSALRDSLSNLFNNGISYVPKTPGYLDVFGKAKSSMEARWLFENGAEGLANNPYALLDLAQYFRERWREYNISDSLLKQVLDDFSENPQVLKSLAYRYGVLQKYDDALDVSLRVLQLDSLSVQSYVDVAETYSAMGNREKALEVYERYKLIKNNSAFSVGQFGVIDSMAMAATANSGLEMGGGAGMKSYGTRIVATWTDPDIELGLQLVSPESRSYAWNCTEKTSWSQSKEYRHSSVHYFVPEEPKGEWQLNLYHYAGGTNEPTYLKVTIFSDYGLPSQTRTLRLFKLVPEYDGFALMNFDTRTNTVVGD